MQDSTIAPGLHTLDFGGAGGVGVCVCGDGVGVCVCGDGVGVCVCGDGGFGGVGFGGVGVGDGDFGGVGFDDGVTGFGVGVDDGVRGVGEGGRGFDLDSINFQFVTPPHINIPINNKIKIKIIKFHG